MFRHSTRTLIGNPGQLRRVSGDSRVAANFKYCLESVKTNDYDAYLSTLVGPKEITRAAIAIRAFNIELLSIAKYNREVNVSLAKVGLIQVFVFWQDCY